MPDQPFHDRRRTLTRRRDDQIPSNRELADMIETLKREFEEHIPEEKELFRSAFAGGDPVAHRIAHEQMIAAARAQEEFYRTLKARLTETGLIGILRLIMLLVLIGAGSWVAAKFGFEFKP